MLEKQMTKKQNKNGFTPTGVVYHSTDLPKPTSKSHSDLNLSDDDVIHLYREMYLQRRFEERAMQMYQKGKFGGFLHVYMGQEAISTGSAHVLRENDDIITAYRDHGMGLVRGISPEHGMAELYGKVTGCSHGKGGSMHFFNVENHFWGGHAIVGAHIPVAAGIALANKYRGEDRVTLCYLGDGAVEGGAFYETLNMSKLWELPVGFVIENNGYAMGTAAKRHGATELYKRAEAFDMKSAVINGMDLFSVIEGLGKVAESIRKNSEPWLVEIRTYRYRGHSMSDPANYRSDGELEEFRKTDPIERLKNYILKHKLAKQADLDKIDSEVDKEVLAAIDFAEESEFPSPADLYRDVFVEDDFPFAT